MEEKTNERIIENSNGGVRAMPMVPLRGKVVFPDIATSFDVGRPKSLAAVEYALGAGQEIFVSSQKDSEEENPATSDVYEVGVVCRIRQIVKMLGNNVRVTVQGLYRAKITSFIENDDFFEVESERMFDPVESASMIEAVTRTAKENFRTYIDTCKVSKECEEAIEIGDPETFLYVATFHSKLKDEDKQQILEGESLVARLESFCVAIGSELEILGLEKKIAARVRQNIDKGQKEFYLREQLRAIHTELGDDEEEQDRLRESILEKKMPKEVEDKALKELSKMDKMPSSSPEYTVIRNYFDWLLDLPFNETTEDTPDLNDVVRILNEDHYGLEKVKERIIEYLAVLKLTGKIHGPILCFVGPPGVGKTSVARSIARALGRKFVRMSLGGVKDEAEIRGHRRTYIGAMPGRIIYAMKDAGTVNPVFLLDEIDKIAMDLRGDPSSALLEVLDPEQNDTFRDRFMEIPYDLSKVLFITTANSLDTIPAPLLDRMEVIRIPGYTLEEKVEIANRYLIAKQTEANGLNDSMIKIEESAVREVIEGYTMEAGVRTLEREIGSLCRKVATKAATEKDMPCQVIDGKAVENYLGARKYYPDEALKEDEVGAVTGLAWTAVGGTTLTVECMLMKGKGELKLTGKLGDVMKESAQAAVSYIRSHADEYCIKQEMFDEYDVHIHVPEGATPKDGPSAGITIATAILSAFTGRKVKKSVAMTGEITLRGKVLPIGGLKEKALAAYRLGIRDIIIPKANLKDTEEIPESVRNNIRFVTATEMEDVFREAFVQE